MHPTGVLVFGAFEESIARGIRADERAIAAENVFVKVVSTGSVVESDGKLEIVAASVSTLSIQIDSALKGMNCKAVKIGAFFSIDSIKLASSILKKSRFKVVMDAEAFFNTGRTPTQELISALRTDILPYVDVLSATVAEAGALFDNAGVPFCLPMGIPGVKVMTKALQNIGPKYTIIKREISDDEMATTTLHYVLSGPTDEPVLVTSRSENPLKVFGASTSVPPIIAARLAQGYGVTEAVAAGFKFVEEMLEGGEYFRGLKAEYCL